MCTDIREKRKKLPVRNKFCINIAVKFSKYKPDPSQAVNPTKLPEKALLMHCNFYIENQYQLPTKAKQYLRRK